MDPSVRAKGILSTLTSTLEYIGRLNCGCVTVGYLSQPGDVRFVILEAKGPHCLTLTHRPGEVTKFELPDEWDSCATDTYDIN